MFLSMLSLTDGYKHGFESLVKLKSNKGFMDGIFEGIWHGHIA